ncbi:MAG: methyltransferase domain-containing protein [Gemmatimonadales bacterium]|nr:methyltransferase domain-containing protein [Gemmatimonadales bacterium]
MTELHTDLTKFYARRAPEYERIYQRPERQAELRRLERAATEAFPEMDVLEVACGTGYWTQFIARSARSILATDTSRAVLERAGEKDFGACDVSLLEADAYSLDSVPGVYSAGFAGFWWSHIPKNRIADFVQSFHGHLEPDARVVLMDNSFVEGSSTPISRTDEDDNTYQIRHLEDGSRHEILKNFPGEENLRASLAPWARDVEFVRLTHYWLCRYRVARRSALSDT